jgi:Putative peptidoglycan binding domain
MEATVGFLDWKYTASDLADWFDEQDEQYWRQHDDWLIQSQNLGNASPVVVFASWYSDRFNTIGERVQHSLAGGVVDVLRLGNDFDFSSGWGIGKGVFLNLTRVATVAGPVSEVLGVAGRYAGIVATAKLQYIEEAAGPCAYTSVNNVLSLLKGKPVQLFATVEDIVKVRGINAGIGRDTLLASAEVQTALSKLGVTFEKMGGMKSIDDVLRAAETAKGPVAFGVQWTKPGGEVAKHALTAVKDANGVVRILDYVEESDGVFKGFASMEEMLKARPQWKGFETVTLNSSAPVHAFNSRYLKLLSFSDGSFSLAVPVAMGMQWLRGGSKEDKIFDMARSVWRFVRAQHPNVAPPPQEPSEPPEIPDSLSAIPSAPDQAGKRLGVSPLPSEAQGAPRIDWLTGVQFRLKYLGYYRGTVSGANDPSTQRAVLAFQKDWFEDASQWDAIPGPKTQGALYAALGW